MNYELILLSHDSRLVNLDGFAKNDERMFEVFLVEDVGHTDLILSKSWSNVETVAWSHHDCASFKVKVAETPSAELLGIVDRQLDHCIESTHWNWRIYSVDAVETIDEELTALNIFVVCVEHVFRIGIDRSFSNNLTQERWRETSLTELHDVLAYGSIAGYDRTDTDTCL